MTLSLPDLGLPAHVRAQRLRDLDRAVGPLVVLEDRHDGASDGKARSVQRVHELGLLAFAAAEADRSAARLEVAVVRARGDLLVRVLARQPDLEVVGLGRREAE